MIITHHPWRKLLGKKTWSIQGEWLGELNMVVLKPDHEVGSHRSAKWTGVGSSLDTNCYLDWLPEIYDWASEERICSIYFEDYTMWPDDPWHNKHGWILNRSGSLEDGPEAPRQPAPRIWIEDKKQVMMFKLIWGGRRDPNKT